MTVRIFRSTDINAPVLSGTAGALINILDQCLIGGFSPATVSAINRTGSVATVTLAVANTTMFTGDYFTITGSSQSEYNGANQITVVDSTHYTFVVSGTPATPGTGSPLYYKTPAGGWTKPFSGSNLAAYKQASGTMGFYTRIDDTGSVTCRILNYETMSDVNTGTQPIPTTAQLSGGLWGVKSNAADSSARPWLLITNGKLIHLFMNTNASTTQPQVSFNSWGDFVSYKAGDNYAFYAMGGITATLSSGNFLSTYVNENVSDGSMIGHYIARDVSGVGGSIGFGKITNASMMGTPTSTVANFPMCIGGSTNLTPTALYPMAYPSPVDGGLYMEKLWLTTNANAIRGELPGIWCPMHAYPLPSHGDTLIGTGPVAGKTFEGYTWICSQGGQMLIETSNTW
jgi:hypothetical protein